jgi:hypothetical protein
VKRYLLSLHPLNQMFDPIKGWLICDPGRAPASSHWREATGALPGALIADKGQGLRGDHL